MFSNTHFNEKEIIPTIVYEDRAMGGGLSESLFSIFSNPSYNLYLPSIIVNVVVDLVKDSILETLKVIFRKLKSKQKNKRVQLVYSSEETIKYFEFPSEIDEDQFVEGLRDIPLVSKKNKMNVYYTRSIKKKKWIEEDLN